MNRATLTVISLIAAFGFGTLSAGYAFTHWIDISGQQSGPWQWRSAPFQSQNDPYSRAIDHISGQLPIGAAEGRIYTASQDSDGRTLMPNCNYRLEGNVPAARLFTLRVETADGVLLLAQPGLPSALHSDQLLFQQTRFEITVSASAQPGNWLALAAPGPFTLVLTYYGTAIINDENGDSVRLPAIIREACNGV